MRKLLSLLAAFAMTFSQAAAFEHSIEPVAQVYLSIPFGAPTKQEATPRLGFRVDYGYGSTFDDANARVPYSALDWRLNFDGQTSLFLNGADVGELSRRLNAAEDEGLSAVQWGAIAVGAALAGAIIFWTVSLDDRLDDWGD